MSSATASPCSPCAKMLSKHPLPVIPVGAKRKATSPPAKIPENKFRKVSRRCPSPQPPSPSTSHTNDVPKTGVKDACCLRDHNHKGRLVGNDPNCGQRVWPLPCTDSVPTLGDMTFEILFPPHMSHSVIDVQAWLSSLTEPQCYAAIIDAYCFRMEEEYGYPPEIFPSSTAYKRFPSFLKKAESDGILPNSLDEDSIAACEELAVGERRGTFILFPLKKREMTRKYGDDQKMVMGQLRRVAETVYKRMTYGKDDRCPYIS